MTRTGIPFTTARGAKWRDATIGGGEPVTIYYGLLNTFGPTSLNVKDGSMASWALVAPERPRRRADEASTRNRRVVIVTRQ